MKTPRLIVILSLFFIATNALCQADLQIVTPNCTQYSDLGVPCAACQCPRVYDATESPCNTLSYGTVEVGLTRTLSVVIANSAPSTAVTPNLQATVKLVQSGLTDNTAQWEILSGLGTDLTPDGMGGFTVAPILHRVNPLDPAPTKEIKIRFKPALNLSPVGALPVLLKITVNNTDDWCYQDIDSSTTNKLDVAVTLSGTAIRTKIHSVMVLDRSGSMSTIVAPTTNTRYDYLKIASKYFIDLVRTRNSVDDQLGAVWFDDQVGDLVPLRTSTTANLDDAKNTINTSGDLQPRGSTAIGAGLQHGDVMIGTGMPNPAPEGKNLIVLFTDGEENTGPYWIDPNLMPGVPYVNNPAVYTIGMGSDINSPAQLNLSTYAGSHSGTYYYVPESTTYGPMLPTALQTAFLKIYTDISGTQGVVDPVVDVPLFGGPQIVGSAWITSSDRNALFSVFDRPVDARLFDLEMRSPIGEIVKDGALPSGIVGSIKNDDGYAIFFVDFSKASSNSFVGKWDLILRPKVKEATNVPKVVPIGFAASVFSDLKINVGIASSSVIPGSEIKIALDFTESGITIPVKDLLVQLTTPTGEVIDLKAQKDSYGKWVAQYPHTYQSGTYQVFARAKLQNAKGELTTRELTKHIALSYPSPGVANTACISCVWIKVVIVLVVIILIAILIRIYLIRKKV